MIFVDENLDEWIYRHPGLEVLKLKCDNCGLEMRANRPFVEKGYAGLMSMPCDCGANQHSCVSKVTTSRVTFDYWMNLVSNFI